MILTSATDAITITVTQPKTMPTAREDAKSAVEAQSLPPGLETEETYEPMVTAASETITSNTTIRASTTVTSTKTTTFSVPTEKP